MSILSEISKNFDLSQIFEKISFLLKIFEKFDCLENLEKKWFWLNFQNNSFFDQNFWKI